MKKIICTLVFAFAFFVSVNGENDRWGYYENVNGWDRYLLQEGYPGTTHYTERTTYEYNIGHFSDSMSGELLPQSKMIVEWTYFFKTKSANIILTLANGEIFSYIIPNATVYFGSYSIEGPHRGEHMWYIKQGNTLVFVLRESTGIYAAVNIRGDVLN